MPLGADFAWAAFLRLHQDRPYKVMSFLRPGGMSLATEILSRPGPIPFSAIDCYARRYGIDPEDAGYFEVFHAIIERIDNAYLAWEATRTNERIKAAMQVHGNRT